jgi:hypothetical protein
MTHKKTRVGARGLWLKCETRASAIVSCLSSSVNAIMRFFSPSTSRTDRPRSPSSSSSSSASIIVAEDARPFTAPPPTRMNTAQLPSSRLPLSPAASPEKASVSSSMEVEKSRPGRYAAFPKNLHAELEEYDARASRAEPIHYFSDNRHAQYVCRECMIPLVSLSVL